MAPTDTYTPGHRETLADIGKILPTAFNAPLDQTYDVTKEIIKDHPFFHQGVMDLPIGGGKHFRNVPFVGPEQIVAGALKLDGLQIKKGLEISRATWDAQ